MLCPFLDSSNTYCEAQDYFSEKYFSILEKTPKCTKEVCPFVAKETCAFVDCKEIEEML